MNPYAPNAGHALGMAYWFNGRHAEAIENFEECWRRGNNDPDRFHWATNVAFANYQLHNYDAALSWADQCLKLWPRHVQALGCRAAALAQIGRLDEARAAMAAFQEFVPGTTASRHVGNFRWKLTENIDHYREGLIKAGMPE